MGENFTSAYERTNLPRDKKQIENKLYNLRKEQKISRDYIYNLYEIAMNLDPFIIEMKLLPELEDLMSKSRKLNCQIKMNICYLFMTIIQNYALICVLLVVKAIDL
jgi:hypothetical protein